MTNYGKIGGIWFDGEWDRSAQWFDLEKTYRMIHELQPQALAGNNHHHAPAPGEDFQIFEAAHPLNRIRDPFIPLETCDSMTIGAWGYTGKDEAQGDAAHWIRGLVAVSGQGGNLLLNTGPKLDGTIPAGHRQVLEAMGKWLRENGESIGGTRRGPWVWRLWGVSAYRGNIAFLHVLKRPRDRLVIPSPPQKLIAAKVFKGSNLAFQISDDPVRGREIGLTLPQKAEAGPIDCILELTFDGSLAGQWIPEPIRPNARGSLVLAPRSAALHGESIEESGTDSLLWKDERDWLAWTVQAPRAGKYAVTVVYACPEGTSGHAFSVGTKQSRVHGRGRVFRRGVLPAPADGQVLPRRPGGQLPRGLAAGRGDGPGHRAEVAHGELEVHRIAARRGAEVPIATGGQAGGGHGAGYGPGQAACQGRARLGRLRLQRPPCRALEL